MESWQKIRCVKVNIFLQSKKDINYFLVRLLSFRFAKKKVRVRIVDNGSQKNSRQQKKPLIG
jgi:hypothetical protein